MLNLDPTEVRSLAAMTLQEDRMEMTRKLFYGIILDNRNTDILRRYLEDRSCSVDECRDILLKQLVGLIPGKTITDIRLVHLLSECGNAAIDRTKTHVQNIFIIKLGLLPNDQITLATIIKQLAPLNSVYIYEVIFHKFLDAYLKESPQHAKSYEVQRLTLQDEALAKETIDIFLAQLRDAGCKEMGLTSCCLTEEKLHLIAERCKAGKTALSRLAIYEDKYMPVTAYREISWLLQATKCKEMLFGHCNLSSNRLREFGCGCHEIDMTLTMLSILDKSMSRDAFRECATTLQATKCKIVVFSDCDLAPQKLTEFGSACLLIGLSLSVISICDKTMTEDGYGELSNIIKSSKCPALRFEDCDLNKDKLIFFRNSCRENDVTLTKLSISDDSMPPNAFKECATTLHVTRCEKVSFCRCHLNVKNLHEFRSGCSENDLLLSSISIIDQTMAEDGYSELSNVINTTKCSSLQFENCGLNRDKLISFCNSCREKNVTLSKMSIWDSSMTADAFKECATTLHITQCKAVSLGGCNLTVQKLSEFGSGCLENSLSLSSVTIIDNTMTEDGYSELANVINATTCSSLQFQNCDLKRGKLIAFNKSCRENNVKLSKMSIWDSSMTADAFKECARTLHITHCKEVSFGSCNLTVQKLSEFGSGCLENNLSLLRLSIVNETMTEHGYSELPRVVNASECSCLQLQNCNLNQNKLISFHESCRENNVTLTRLSIYNNSIPADALRECATTLRVTECGEVVFFHCNLTVEKLSEFRSGSSKNGLSLSMIAIVDKTLTEDGYSELSNVIYATKCRNLELEGCDLNWNKLISFCNGCRKNNTTMAKLKLNNIGKVATDVVSALCELMIDVVESLEMLSCEVDDDGCLRLKDTLNLRNTKVKSLRLPNEDFVYKVQAAKSKPRP